MRKSVAQNAIRTILYFFQDLSFNPSYPSKWVVKKLTNYLPYKEAHVRKDYIFEEKSKRKHNHPQKHRTISSNSLPYLFSSANVNKQNEIQILCKILSHCSNQIWGQIWRICCTSTLKVRLYNKSHIYVKNEISYKKVFSRFCASLHLCVMFYGNFS